MTTKEEGNNLTTETKTEEILDNATTEDVPTSLETSPEGTAIRNGTQTMSKDKAKTPQAQLFHAILTFTFAVATLDYDIRSEKIYVEDCYKLVDILLKATANAPIMKQKKWSVCQDNPIGRISEFIKKYLKLDPNERLVLIYFHLCAELIKLNEYVLYCFANNDNY
ncbi:uncharacterized protein LOC105190938 isoform X3 [Harpegnathos saltator]|uniref:uncharacterized protein LOC105190938 isoform X3 n=1 Tax=Harpegnathos saltator TaxID=610380 RepID=UPI0009491BF2|nr:uncharacterized protein LOC105190938 isoform X3 [Harpegnathos saltator]